MRKIFIKLVKLYQKYISTLTKPSCRFYPTCSQYTIEAFEKFGVLKGFYLGVRRILRCNPFHKGGIDRVPDTFHFRKNKWRK